MTSTMLGELEKQVLLALLRLGGESYAVPVAHELTELTGREVSPAVKGVAITFYGSSLIINEEGGLAGRCRVFAGEEERRRQLPDYDSSDSEEDELAVEPQDEGIELIWHDFDTHKIAAKRHSWGDFRDRRPDLYRGLAGRSMAPG